ncbi:MAG: MoaD/ThiS family protein [Armatimonadetes bacterium]|nr:MoaD/ThiS family protein [Armatimonadota bacterium]
MRRSNAVREPAGEEKGVTVEVRAFARAREIMGLRGLAVNREYVGLDHLLQDGDELAVIPPVSGG